MHLLVDSTGLKLCGPGEWLIEKHGTKRRRAWRVLHLATDADTGRIVASVLTDKDADDGSQVGPLLDRIDGAMASFTGDGAYDRDDVYAEVAARHPAAAVVVPPRANAVPSDSREPRRRSATGICDASRSAAAWAGRRPQDITGALWWRPISRAGNALLAAGCASQTEGRQATEVAIATSSAPRHKPPAPQDSAAAPRKTRAPWPAPGACGTPPGRSHRPRALEIPASQYQALSC